MTSLFFMNTRSVPANFQMFIDSILTCSYVKSDIFGFTEARLDADLVNLYQIADYNMHRNHRNRCGGGVAMHISLNMNSAVNNEFHRMESYIEYIVSVYLYIA